MYKGYKLAANMLKKVKIAAATTKTFGFAATRYLLTAPTVLKPCHPLVHNTLNIW